VAYSITHEREIGRVWGDQNLAREKRLKNNKCIRIKTQQPNFRDYTGQDGVSIRQEKRKVEDIVREGTVLKSGVDI